MENQQLIFKTELLLLLFSEFTNSQYFALFRFQM